MKAPLAFAGRDALAMVTLQHRGDRAVDAVCFDNAVAAVCVDNAVVDAHDNASRNCIEFPSDFTQMPD